MLKTANLCQVNKILFVSDYWEWLWLIFDLHTRPSNISSGSVFPLIFNSQCMQIVNVSYVVQIFLV